MRFLGKRVDRGSGNFRIEKSALSRCLGRWGWLSTSLGEEENVLSNVKYLFHSGS